MVGQINGTAELNGDGITLLVTGWLRFDPDEDKAVMDVTVTQGAGAQAPTAKGESGEVTRGQKAWTAEIRATGHRQKFVPGPALAVVTAEITKKNGETEYYPEQGGEPWARYITLVG